MAVANVIAVESNKRPTYSGFVYKSIQDEARLSPEVLKPRRAQLGVPHGMRDTLVPQIGLQGAGVVTLTSVFLLGCSELAVRGPIRSANSRKSSVLDIADCRYSQP